MVPKGRRLSVWRQKLCTDSIPSKQKSTCLRNFERLNAA